jgi:ABC-2 type transport system permease protein
VRISSLARAELLLFRRSPLTVINALVPPAAIIALAASSRADSAVTLVTGLLALVQLGTVYYTLVTTYTARREELVLKRLRAGVLTDAEILAGTAAPAVAVALAQILIYLGLGAFLLGLPAPADVPLLVLGVLGGVAVFVPLAALTAVCTRTADLAQLTTLPVVLACLLGSGLLVAPDTLPGPVEAGLRLLPMTPALELMRLGWSGGSAGLAPILILTAWGVLAVLAARRWFRWEPRR